MGPLILLVLGCGEPTPLPDPTRDDWARIAVEDPDPIARREAILQLHFLDDPELPGIALASLKGHDRATDPTAARDVGGKLLLACLEAPNACPWCGPCPEGAHPACSEIDWDREGCFAGEGDACPVPSRPQARGESLCPLSGDANLADWHVEQARFLVQAHAAEPVDPCDALGWGLQALASLNRAIETRPAVLDAIRADPQLADFRASAAYQRWDAAAAVDLGDPAATAAWASTRRWTRPGADLVLEPEGTYALRRTGATEVLSSAWEPLGPKTLQLHGLGLVLVQRTSVGLSLDAEGQGAFLTGDVYCSDPPRP